MNIIQIISFFFISYTLSAQMDKTPTVLDPAFGQKIESYLSHSVELMDVETLHDRYEEFTIIDVRKREEYTTSHLMDAIWVAPGLPENKLPDLDADKPILVYCSVGARSETLGERLQKKGYQVYNLYGGIFEWVNRGYPVYTGPEGDETESYTIHTFNFMFRPYVTNKDYKRVGLLSW